MFFKHSVWSLTNLYECRAPPHYICNPRLSSATLFTAIFAFYLVSPISSVYLLDIAQCFFNTRRPVWSPTNLFGWLHIIFVTTFSPLLLFLLQCCPLFFISLLTNRVCHRAPPVGLLLISLGGSTLYS